LLWVVTTYRSGVGFNDPLTACCNK